MAYLKIYNRLIYLSKSRIEGLQKVVLSDKEILIKAIRADQKNSPEQRKFLAGAALFLKEVLTQDESIFRNDFEKIDMWGEEAQSEISDLIRDWCYLTGKLIIKDLRDEDEKFGTI